MEKPAGRREAGALILPVSYALTLNITKITFGDFLKAGLYNNGRGYVIMGKIFAYYTQISNLITLISYNSSNLSTGSNFLELHHSE